MENYKINKLFEKEISCVFATDDYYLPYLSVVIESIIENSSNNNCYGIYVLEENLSDTNKYKLKLQERDNIKINFINTKSFVDEYRSIFYLNSYPTIATYYRFFIPAIFENFEKILYLDCDLIINCDIADLYNINLENNIAACVRDTQISCWNFQNIINEEDKKYYLETLKLKKIDDYFNAGVMLFDINELKKNNCTEKYIEFLREIKSPKFADQCIMNHVLKDNVMLLNSKWNYQNAIATYDNIKNEYKNIFYESMAKELTEAQKNPKIIHYICQKPWENLNLINGEYFWKYARKSPFYENIIYISFMKNIKLNTKKSDLQCDTKNFYKNIYQRIFSIKNSTNNENKYKVITILGIKIKRKI